MIIFFASLLTDMSISVADAATRITSSLPSTFHSPDSSRVHSIVWFAVDSAFRTAARTSSVLADCGWGRVCNAGCAATAGADDPMMIGVELTAAVVGRCGGLVSGVASDRGVPFRAESAANGDTNGRAGAAGSAFLGSGAMESLRSGVAGRLTSAPLNNCSIGSSLCAWASFNNPSSR